MRAVHLGSIAFGAALLAAAGAGASPRVDYMLNCMGCHLVDGSGAPGKVPSFREHLGSLLAAPGGREFLVQVPGSAQSPLSDERLAGVLNWIIANFAAGSVPDFTPYTALEVNAYRSEPLLDVPARREALLRPTATGKPDPNLEPHSTKTDVQGVPP